MSDRGRASTPVLVLITGLPGSGKSTVAAEAADLLGTAVLGHDWAMSGLRPYEALQRALDAMEPPGHGRVGWSILLAMARSELRGGQSVVLDGVARTPEIEQCGRLARDEGVKLIVILVECPDLAVHSSRIVGRDRAIPDWYELTWEQVQRSRDSWTPPDHVDLRLDTTRPRTRTTRLLVDLLRR